ncbi:MAG: AtpZ/AtpI family protein [Dehalococcoidia bacterium]
MKNRPWLASAFQFVGIGWYIAVSIVGGTLGGVWLDGKAGTAPLFLLLGLLLGLGLAFYGAYRMAAVHLTGRRDSKRRGRRKS